MTLNKYKLCSLIIPYSQKCGIPNLTAYQVSGVNKDKEFFEPSHQVGEDTSKYQVVPPRHFACNLMHVGRDRVLPIAYNHSKNDKYVSPAYTVFSLKEGCGVLDDYFFIMLKCEEQDRFFWFHADASVRDGMSWSDFCDVQISVPDLPTQQKYVDIYKAMVANQQSYERGLEDLKNAFDASIDRIKHTATCRPVGELVYEIDNRNENGEITSVQGINITKQFMPSVANTNGIDLTKYKLVKKNQFAFSGMQTGRDKCIRIALNKDNNPIITSPAYTVLDIKDDEIIPEYIMMWFSRKESDRRGWFMSDSSIRSNLDLDRFYEIQLPIPCAKTQRSIVDIFNVYIARRNINEQLKAQIKNICPILIRGSLEEGIESEY